MLNTQKEESTPKNNRMIQTNTHHTYLVLVVSIIHLLIIFYSLIFYDMILLLTIITHTNHPINRFNLYHRGEIINKRYFL